VADRWTQNDERLVEKATPLFRDRFMTRMKATAKTVLPAIVSEELQRFRSFERNERLLYFKIRTLNGLRVTKPKRLRLPATARSFVFLCSGNIMRSPMCKALMNRALTVPSNTRITTISAGLNAVPGSPAHPWAITAARKWDISLENHRSRRVTAEIVSRADVLFVMDYQNQVQLLTRHPESRSKVFMLSAYASEEDCPVEIRDPYYMGEEETSNCYEILNTCIQRLVSDLSL
jgi:protein-tyrosine-phosphatase